MENSIKTDEIYEVKFEQLVETEKQQLSAVNDIMEGLMDVSVFRRKGQSVSSFSPPSDV